MVLRTQQSHTIHIAAEKQHFLLKGAEVRTHADLLKVREKQRVRDGVGGKEQRLGQMSAGGANQNGVGGVNHQALPFLAIGKRDITI